MVVARQFGRHIVDSLKNSTKSGAQYAVRAYNSCLDFHHDLLESRNSNLRAALRQIKATDSPTVFAFHLKRDFMLESFFSVRVTSASEFPGGPPALIHIISKLPTSYDSATTNGYWQTLLDFDTGITQLSKRAQDAEKRAFHELWEKLTNLHLTKNALPMSGNIFFASFSKLQTYPNLTLSAALEALSQGIVSRDTMIRFQYDIIYIDGLLSRYPVAAKRVITAQLLQHLITNVPDQRETIEQASVFGSKFPLTPEDTCLSFLTTSSLSLVIGASLLDYGTHLPIAERMAIRHLLGEIKESLQESIYSHFVNSDRQTMIGVMGAIDSVQAIVGYPIWLETAEADKKIDEFYKQLDFTDASYSTFLDFVRRLGQFFWRKQFAHHILHEANPSPPHFSTNALFSRQRGIELQWGLLQAPLYQPDMPLVSLYGSVGFVLSHELMHLISYYKRIFAATNERAFLNQSACFDAFYDQFCFELANNGTNRTICASGSNDSEENIADAEGLGLAYRAFERKFSGGDIGIEKLRKYSPKQLFFLSFAARFCGSYTPEHLMRHLQDELDPHAPDVVRVNGAVSISEHFAQAFNCPKGSRMNRETRCSLFA
uniref:Peptidase M13 C-terminal domain-containing protein n=1 Tax=Plectus sambesii TaxID=2011161 RepID=A0A914UXR9_9BILA